MGLKTQGTVSLSRGTCQAPAAPEHCPPRRTPGGGSKQDSSQPTARTGTTGHHRRPPEVQRRAGAHHCTGNTQTLRHARRDMQTHTDVYMHTHTLQTCTLCVGTCICAWTHVAVSAGGPGGPLPAPSGSTTCTWPAGAQLWGSLGAAVTLVGFCPQQFQEAPRAVWLARSWAASGCTGSWGISGDPAGEQDREQPPSWSPRLSLGMALCAEGAVAPGRMLPTGWEPGCKLGLGHLFAFGDRPAVLRLTPGRVWGAAGVLGLSPWAQL